MQLSETRFVKIDGTNISASVNSATEAKIAIKEIRQKKKEFAHIKRGLMRQKKDAERQAGTSRGKKGVKTGFFHSVRATGWRASPAPMAPQLRKWTSPA